MWLCSYSALVSQLEIKVSAVCRIYYWKWWESWTYYSFRMYTEDGGKHPLPSHRNIYSRPSLLPRVMFYKVATNTQLANTEPRLPDLIQGSVPGRLCPCICISQLVYFRMFWFKDPFLSRYSNSFALTSWPTVWELASGWSQSNVLIFSIRPIASFLPLGTEHSPLAVQLVPLEAAESSTKPKQNHKNMATKDTTKRTRVYSLRDEM